MILFELSSTEQWTVYQKLAASNAARHYDFLRSVIEASLEANKPFLSHDVIKALNYHAIACLHTSPGEYRPCPVVVGKPPNQFLPPEQHRVQALMDDLINEVNRHWDKTDPVYLSCYVLWRLNHIHPFINGNGRTARAASYFALCVKVGGWLPGSPIIPELIKRDRAQYVSALKAADASLAAGKGLDLGELHTLMSSWLSEQLASAAPSAPATPADASPSPPAVPGPAQSP